MSYLSLKLSQLNVIENERRQGTRHCWIFTAIKDKGSTRSMEALEPFLGQGV